MIKIENFSHSYDTIQVVRELSLHIEAGDVYGFIGPNGAGKTTTIRFLATLLKPRQGKAWIDDVDIVRSPHEARKVLGFMPDDFGVYHGMKVHEYLDFFAMAYGITEKRRQTVSDIIELVDLRAKADSPASQLSRGMRQRLGLARALLHDPKVLLLDEPASGLDPRGRIEIMELLKELQNMGKTILVASHILPEIANYCNKIGIMVEGRLLVQGNLQEISRRLSPHKRQKLTVLSKEREAESVLQKSPHVAGVKRSEKILHFQFIGEDEQGAQLLAQLIEAKIPVLYMEEAPVTLEEVFVSVVEKASC